MLRGQSRADGFSPESARQTACRLLLEDVVESCLALGQPIAIQVTGRSGAGKSVALAHLASLPFANRLILVDDAAIVAARSGRYEDSASLELIQLDDAAIVASRPDHASASQAGKVVVCSAPGPFSRSGAAYELEAWSTDDVIEYLLATRPDRCKSVIARFAPTRIIRCFRDFLG
jgi:hypothetical protein